jgi:hypothetical protein
MLPTKEKHDKFIKELAEKYERQGYEVFMEPDKGVVPFDLGNYRPALVAKRGTENVMIEIKAHRARFSIERFGEIVDTVSKHQGWKFLLVTMDDESIDVDSDVANKFVSSDGVLKRIVEVEALIAENHFEASLLLLWSTVEALLRHSSEVLSLAVERLPTSSVIKHLYSEGELSFEQYEKLLTFYELRNRVTHGFQASVTKDSAADLLALVREIITELYQEEVNA